MTEKTPRAGRGTGEKAGHGPSHGPSGKATPGETRVIPRAAPVGDEGNGKGTADVAPPSRRTPTHGSSVQSIPTSMTPRADRAPRPLPATKADRASRAAEEPRRNAGPVPISGPVPKGTSLRSEIGSGRSAQGPVAPQRGDGSRPSGSIIAGARGGQSALGGNGVGAGSGAGTTGAQGGAILAVAKRGPVTTTLVDRDEADAPPPPASYVTLVVFGPLRSEGADSLLRDGRPHVLQGLVGILEECAYAPSEASVGEFLAKVVGEVAEAHATPAPLPAASKLPPSEGGPFPPAHAPGVRHGLLVVLHEGRVVAFLQARQAFEDVEIEYVAVHPTHRNRGLGARLLEALEAAALHLGVGRLLLEVGERNIPARQLYRSFGFELLSRRENYYHGREAALVLEKIL